MVDKEKIEYLDPLRNFNIDPHDWSFAVKKQYDEIDRLRISKMNKNLNVLRGNEKRKYIKASFGTRNLKRWGYRA